MRSFHRINPESSTRQFSKSTVTVPFVGPGFFVRPCWMPAASPSLRHFPFAPRSAEVLVRLTHAVCYT